MPEVVDVLETRLIADETRRTIVDVLLAKGNIAGDKDYYEFAKLVFPQIDENTLAGISRHMDCFDDWPESYLLDTCIDYIRLSDAEFFYFLEQYVNPNLHHSLWSEEDNCRQEIPNSELVDLINKYLCHDGYKLIIKDRIGDKAFYQVASIHPGVRGTIKNIIFAAKYKPEIVFDDALNNDIRILKNEDQCLIYDRPIPVNGLMWGELVGWYSQKVGHTN